MSLLAALPALNASLNATSAVCLVTGYLLIRRRRLIAHAVCMGIACVVSLAFLISYLSYHAQVGSVRFTGQGWIRPVYFTILLSHTVLAILVVPFVVRTLILALRRRFDQHSRIAKLTLPVWLYVSITGVVVYVMLYHVR